MPDGLSPIWPFPCDRCDRTEGCPCIVDDIAVRRARAEATRRHRAAVALAAVSRWLDRRRAA